MKEWAYQFSIQGGNKEKIERILETFIEAVDAERLSCAGSITELIPCSCGGHGCFNTGETIIRNSEVNRQ